MCVQALCVLAVVLSNLIYCAAIEGLFSFNAM